MNGHGAKLDYLGFLQHEELLRRYGAHLVGMHIHDTRNGRAGQYNGTSQCGAVGRC